MGTRLKFGLGFANLGAEGVYYSSNVDANYNLEDVMNRDFPLRPIISSTTANMVIRLHIARSTQEGSTDITAIAVRHCNSPTINFKGTTSGDKNAFASPIHSEVISANYDSRTNRYNGIDMLVTPSTAASGEDYWEFTFTGTVVGGGYRVGSQNAVGVSPNYRYCGCIYFIHQIISLNHDRPPEYSYRKMKSGLRVNREDKSFSYFDYRKQKIMFSIPVKLASENDAPVTYNMGGEYQINTILNRSDDDGYIIWEDVDWYSSWTNEQFSRFYHVKTVDDYEVQYPGTTRVIESTLDAEEVV